jgi:hypothetical protein
MVIAQIEIDVLEFLRFQILQNFDNKFPQCCACVALVFRVIICGHVASREQRDMIFCSVGIFDIVGACCNIVYMGL